MIKFSNLDKYVLKILEDAGWITTRSADIKEQLQILESEGYKPFEYAIRIMQSFDGIYISAQKSKGVKSYIGDVEFDCVGAGSGEYDRLEIFEEICKESIFPIGMVFGQWFLYVGKSNKIYMGDYNKFYLLGENIEEFLTNIIMTGNKPIQL